LKDLIVDGKCKHLSGNLCAIYDSRPEYCRIDSNHMGMGSPDYYRLTGIICNLWAVEDGLGEQIDIDQFRSQT
jgi:Fe-S-cluster containining protein